jgi:cyclopropane fatty-acyl-phospholipid synthase-like methyltransferase
MEKFRGKTVVIPRTRDWKAIDETDKYSKEQRMRCEKETGKKCTLYPFPVGMTVISMFKPKRWLDLTAGWGDRLRVAIASGVEYVGVDSNVPMQSAYKAIIDDKAGGDAKKYKVKQGRFQDVRIYGKFDLMFTSPPFFTEEVYEGMTSWKDVEHFMTEFLEPFLKKAYNHLEIGGHIVLYIEDRPETPYIHLMKEYVKRFIPGLTYEGAFYYQGAKPRPYYVWKRTR